MDQQNKDKQQQEGLSRVNSNQNPWKRFFAKRWTYPAVYLGAAALIIGLMYTKTHDLSPLKMNTQGATPAPSSTGTPSDTPAASAQNFIWPVGSDGQAAVVTQNFFNVDGSDDMKKAELVQYDGTWYPQTGIVMGLKNDSPFTVVAAAGGTVEKVDENPLMGLSVLVKDDNGYETFYASLQDIVVKAGDHIAQGADIGKSGDNKFEMTQKNHLHFEIRDKDGKLVDPVKSGLLPPREGSVADVSAASASSSKDSAAASDANAASRDGGAKPVQNDAGKAGTDAASTTPAAQSDSAQSGMSTNVTSADSTTAADSSK